MPTEFEPETYIAQRHDQYLEAVVDDQYLEAVVDDQYLEAVVDDQYLEAVVDDHVAVEERPLALNYSTWKQ
jgi:hypothetical protein